MNNTQNNNSRQIPRQNLKNTKPVQSGNSGKPVQRRKTNMPIEPRSPEKIVRYKGSMDRTFLILVLILICFGSVMVFSASYAYSMAKNDGNGYAFISKQIINVLIGLVLMFVVSHVLDPHFLERNAKRAYVITCLLLLLVFIIGTVGGGAKRWLVIAGISIQPSEIAKATLVFVLASHFQKNSEKITNPKNTKEGIIYGLVHPLLYTGIVCGLVILQPHLSGTIILFLIGIAVMWAGGTSAKAILIPGAVGGTLLTAVALLVPYTKRRIDIWLHPENDLTGDGWQTIQGLRAIGSGGLLGLGPANSRQKHMYVSQPQNDFIFSILCEELGFIGAVAVIILFILLIIRGYQIAIKTPDTFSSLVVTGIISKIGIQAAFNIGVVTNLIPNTGVSLPFFSYGGSSTIVLLVEMGVILSISRFSRQER